MTQRQFYRSGAWHRARSTYIAYRKAVDGGVCEVCGQALGYIVHHKIWLNDQNCNDPEIALNPKNLRYECQTCHNGEKDPDQGGEPLGRIRYGPEGEIIPVGDY